jgi:hypothetical protein
MAHPPELRQRARNLYVRQRLPVERVAAESGVAPATVASWKRKAKEAGDDWDRARNAARVADGGMGEVTHAVMEDFVLFAETIIPEIKASGLTPQEKVQLIASFADSWSKFLRVMGKASPELSRLSVAFEVLRELARFLAARHPAELERFEAILEPFGEHLNKEWSA